MKMNVLGQEKEFDLLDPSDRKEVLSSLCNRASNRIPTFSFMLMGNCKYHNAENGIGYTVHDPLENYFSIHINYGKMNKETPGALFALALHELLHNVFLHFVNKTALKYRKKNPDLTNILLDSIINSTILKVLDGNSELEKESCEFLEKTGFTLDTVQKSFNVQLDLGGDIPSLEHLFKAFDHLFNDPDFDTGSGGVGEDEKDEEGSGKESGNEKEGSGEKGGNGESNENGEMGGEISGGSGCGKRKEKELLDDHDKSFEEAQSKKDEFGKTDGSYEDMCRSLCQSIISKAEEAGAGSETEMRLIKIGLKKSTVLKIVKLRTTLNDIGRKSHYMTYSKVNRRRKYVNGLPKRGKNYEGTSKIVYLIDVSASMTDEEHKSVASEIASFHKKHREVSGDLIYWSCDHVFEDDIVKDFMEVKDYNLNPKSNCGTEIGHVIKFIDKRYEKEKKMVVCVFTDLEFTYRNFPEKFTPYFFVTGGRGIPSAAKSFYNKSKILELK